MGTLTSTDATEAGPRSWGESRCVQKQEGGPPVQGHWASERQQGWSAVTPVLRKTFSMSSPHPMTQQYTPFYLLVFLATSRRWEDAAYTDMHTKKSALERKGQIEASVQKGDVPTGSDLCKSDWKEQRKHSLGQ